MNDRINTILEGCDHDSPGKLQYFGFNFEIPQARVLNVRGGINFNDRFYLTARIGSFDNEGTFARLNTKKLRGDDSQKGIDIEKFERNITWIFEQLRSFTTRDGRIYLSGLFFKEDWRWYPIRDVLIDDCGDIYSGRRDFEDLQRNSWRAF